MVAPTFLVSAAITLPLAIAYLAVGTRLHRRSREQAQPALSWFAAFWVGMGAYGVAEAAWMWSEVLGIGGFPFALLVLHLKIVAMTAAMGGLVVYVLSIHGVDRRALAVVVALYAVLLAVVETFYSWRGPVAQEPGVWGMRLVYVLNDVQPWWTLVLALLLVPPFVATIGYAMLLRATTEPVVRYRILLTSVSLFAFFIPVFVGWRAGGTSWWGAVEKLLSALMALGVGLAIWPPAPVQAWLRRREAKAAEERAQKRSARQLV